jgi:hypothetical protein
VSELGQISAELNAALGRLAAAANRFGELDRNQLAPLQAELARSPQGQSAAALIGRARELVRQAEAGVRLARAAGAGWLAEHGSGEAGGGGEGVRTQSGRAYFDAGETATRESVSAVPRFDGEYTFAAHGSSDSVWVGDSEAGVAELAELVRADPEWGGRPVRLLACHTGRGEHPIAAQLAEHLGVAVTAPDELAWVTADGGIEIAAAKTVVVDGSEFQLPDPACPGQWRVFAAGKGKRG